MTGRTLKILSRFPAHLEATRPGKQLSSVTDALAKNLDELSAIMARIRRSHRLQDSDELRDLLLIGAFHGITLAEQSLLFTRFERAKDLLLKLSEAATSAERDAAAEALCDLWAIALPRPRLPLFAPPTPDDVPDLEAAKARLMQHVNTSISNGVLLDAVRNRIATIARIHASGNGTIGALLKGTANALDLDLIEVVHSKDRFWHAATVRDRLTLTRPVEVEPASDDGPAREVTEPFEPATELIGIEENPLERVNTDQVGRYHAELFSVLRRGFERTLLQVRVTGKETLTIGPMVVNRDEGHGVGYARSIPPGSAVVFTEEGRALLDSEDVTSFAYAWKGACFAGTDARPTDFVFDGPGVSTERRARFVETTPAGALDPEFVFPHSGENLPMPGIDVGEIRFAFFVQQAHFSKLEVEADVAHVVRVAPRTAVGFLDASVFAPAPPAVLAFLDSSVFGAAKTPPGAAVGLLDALGVTVRETPLGGGVGLRAVALPTSPDAALVSLSWLEHRAFCVRVLIPKRFRWTPDDADGIQTRQRVAQALRRFQPAGVEVRVEFVDDRWVLGGGTLASGDLTDPIVELRSGTLLWSAPA
ncbi:MAG TPA: hypothetical protein VF290_20875 [Pyrinomonadaceae bacterium]